MLEGYTHRGIFKEMNRNKIILASIFLIVLVGGVVFFLNRNPAPELPLAKTPPAQPLSSGIVYGADGKLDTSNWQEFRSEYGGFSVRAPEGMSQFISCTHACDSYWGDRFEYLLANLRTKTDNYYVEPPGLSVEVIEKNSTSTLDTWLDDYIVYGKEYLTNIQKTTIKGYPALQFDFDEHQPEMKGGLGFATMQYDSYPWGYTSAYGLGNPPYAISRYLIIDLGNRYAFVHYLLSVDRKAEVAYFTSHSYYLSWVHESQLLDDKTLSDVNTAILDSFQAFPPTKP